MPQGRQRRAVLAQSREEALRVAVRPDGIPAESARPRGAADVDGIPAVLKERLEGADSEGSSEHAEPGRAETHQEETAFGRWTAPQVCGYP